MIHPDPDRIVTERVICAREALHMTKTQMAAFLGLSKQGYQAYERFQVHFTVAQVFAIARLAGRPVEYFFGLDTGLTEDEGRALAYYRAARAAGRGEITLGALAALAGGA